MSYEFPSLHIEPDSPEGVGLQSIIDRDHVSPEEAVRKLLRDAGKKNPALAGLGLLGNPEDAALLDEAVSLAYKERRHFWSAGL